MSVATQNPVLLTDGDIAFLRVDNRRPPHALEPGVAASATNKRSEQGKMIPRYGCALDSWGTPGHVVLRPNAQAYPAATPPDVIAPIAVTLVVGQTYRYVMGANEVTGVVDTSTGQLELCAPSGGAGSGTFVAAATSFNLYGTAEMAVTALLLVENVKTCAYARFSDPVTDTDQTLLATDEWRDADGGRGRVWRILPGNAPQEISLNGHDIWDTARFEQCHHAVALARHGNERHYFSAALANNNTISLNVAPAWQAGDRILLQAATDDAAILSDPIAITDSDLAAETLTCSTANLTTGVAAEVTGITGASGTYHIRVLSASTISLYDTRAHALAGGATGRFDVTVDDETGTLTVYVPTIGTRYFAGSATTALTLFADAALTIQLGWASASGKLYVELQRDPVPFWGDGAPVLLMQPGIGTSAFQNGFVAAPVNTLVTETTASVLTAPNHRLAPGDAILLDGLTVGGVAQTFIPPVTTFYAYPTSAHTFTIHGGASGAVEALTGLNPIATITTPDTGQVKKLSAAGVPLPPLREMVYLAGRLWGINGDDEIVFSDPFDFLHFTRFISQVTANQGEAGKALWLRPIGEDVMCVGKEFKIIAISGISGAISGWAEGTITSEYGGLAALAALNAGTDLQFASRKGWASIIRTVAGERLGITRTVSQAIPQDLADIDWGNAGIMCAATWNGRLFWGVPTKGQGAGSTEQGVVNNKVLVLNYNNSQLYVEQAVVEGDIVGGVRDRLGGEGPDSWEGSWTGALLVPYAFARLKVNGDERLTWATPDGLVCWFNDGWDDAGAEIADELITRGYFGSREVLAVKGAFKWETFRPKLSAYIRSAGYNEEEQLAGFDELTYDATKYLVAGQTDYDPSTSTIETFDLPHREDYAPSAEELLVARLDVHQALTEPFRCRVRDHSIQFRIVNQQGSARLCAVSVQASAVGISATRKS
jgi:hypothetical protein